MDRIHEFVELPPDRVLELLPTLSEADRRKTNWELLSFVAYNSIREAGSPAAKVAWCVFHGNRSPIPRHPDRAFHAMPISLSDRSGELDGLGVLLQSEIIPRVPRFQP